jgi:hypothetical protein|tara:strand:+ start:588 stop:1016 length:429 start_codon:yes stop_codon:yes gene_type:complete
MSLVNARAALEDAINSELKQQNPKVSVVFDNMPFTTPGKSKSYVMVSINFEQSTEQSQGASATFYSGDVRCGILTPMDKGTYEASAISEIVITALTNINASSYVDTYSVTPRVSRINGPTTINREGDSHHLSVISCDFTANG